MRRHISQIRDVIVMLYEMATFVVPLFILYLAASSAITPFTMMLALFLFLFPALSHTGVFGDKLKAVINRIMGY